MLKMIKSWLRSFPCNGWQIIYGIVIISIIVSIVGIIVLVETYSLLQKRDEKKHSAYITTHLKEFKGKHKIAHLGEIIILSDKIYLMFTTSNLGGLHLNLVNNGRESEDLLYRHKPNRIVEEKVGYEYYGYIVLEEISIKIHILLANERILIYCIEHLK